jgi:predicted permease
MRWIAVFRSRLRSPWHALVGRRRLEQELDAELQFHLDQHVAENAATGMSAEDARASAARSLGGILQIKEQIRDVIGLTLIDSFFMDVRYACRAMRDAPLFAAGIAATIGLGLGIVTSAFTILNAYVLTPVDLPNPYQLYALNWDTNSEPRHRFALADFEALGDGGAPLFSALVAAEETFVMQDGVPTAGLLVTGNYFPVLGARAAMGRLLTPSDASVPGREAVVVLSDAMWRSHQGADPAVIGKEIVFGRQRVTVVGVTEPGFGLVGEELVGYWAPLTMARAFGAADVWSNRDKPSLLVIGRLRDGSSERQARAWLDAWLRQRFPAHSPHAPRAVHIESRARHTPLTGPILTLLTLLMAAFGLVLLIACANVTNLLLARAFGRQQEIAVRLSLGATGWRIARQLLIESLTLAVPASAAGLAFTVVTARVFPSLMSRPFHRAFRCRCSPCSRFVRTSASWPSSLRQQWRRR